MYLKNFHEYENVQKVTFGRHKDGLFSTGNWYADVTLLLDDGEEYIVRWSLKDIKVIADSKID